ncbi:uncharacterized protein LOC123702546 [Colias croceus]|uniref:uncharacterized protein LOC123702546 n=1 Tax=Colias crocea TaxID=72248 RepID=UPI001E27A87D|nr:uncharacterized protein LOC123702546 [Colias croceus]
MMTRNRPKKTDEADAAAVTHTRPPASPSELRETTTTAPAETETRVDDTQSQASVRTTRSVRSRMKEAQAEAGSKLLALEKKMIALEKEQILKEMEANIARIADDASVVDRTDALPIESTNRVQDWLKRHSQEATAMPLRHGDAPFPTRGESSRQVAWTKDTVGQRRDESPVVEHDTTKVGTPRARSRDRGIEKLTEVFEELTRRRPPPRQGFDLPQFNGNVTEWLYFKAAYEDTTRLYKYTNIENLARLRACLTGAARDTVAVLLSTTNDPELIMRTLNQCYGRPEIIIDRAMDEIKKLPRPGTTAVELNQFAVKVQNIAWLLNSIEDRSYVNSTMLVREILNKLSLHYQARWTDYGQAHGTTYEPIFLTLSNYLIKEADLQLTYNYSKKTETTTVEKRESRPLRRANIYATNNDDKKISCLCCGREHETPKCKEFANMSLSQRWERMKKARTCFQCIVSTHLRSRCKHKKCDIDGCDKPHHPMLHEEKIAIEEKPTEVVLSTTINSNNQAVLLKVCPVYIKSDGEKQIKTYALLDEGSTISLIDEDLARELELDGPTQPLRISGVGASSDIMNSRSVQIKISRRNNGASHAIRVRTMTNLAIGGQTISANTLKYNHLKGLPLKDVIGKVKPKLLIGSDNWDLIISRKLRTGKRGEPVASLTRLGWVIHGTTPKTTLSRENVLHTYEDDDDCVSNKSLEKLMKKSYEIDALGIKVTQRKSSVDERAIRIFEETARRINGRFEVGLPWRTDKPTLPLNYEMARKRLKSIENKMDRCEEFKHAYTAEIQNLINKGYAAPVTNDDLPATTTWYLPHFAVVNPNKPGKLRVVFDAAARDKGVCLNDELLDGPDLLQSLPGILYKYRENEVAVTADVKEMFLQIKIRKQDQGAQLFLWRGDDRTSPPKTFKMTSMIFGARSSPFIAHSVRNKNAEDFRLSHPLAYEAITKNHYMDDFVDSFRTEDEAIQTIKEVIHVHAHASFTLAGWSSNRDTVIQHTPCDLRTQATASLVATNHDMNKTLGMVWIPREDRLSFNTCLARIHTDVKERRRPPSKREALGTVMSIFDPLGLISYYTITAKIILQNLWRLKLDWDEPIPAEDYANFDDWLKRLNDITKLRIPRWYGNTGGVKVELHVFCDASEQAYASAAYWRSEEPNGNVRIALISAKARVAPLKTQSIPRLELQAALIGVRLASAILKEHRLAVASHTYWTDSTTVLQWIRNDKARHTPFVANRLGEIAELTKINQWRWVPTADNVADDATRINNEEKNENDRWFTGPAFLREPRESWPEQTPWLEVAAVEHYTATERADIRQSVPDVTRFSKYERYIRAIAYVLMFINRAKKIKTTLDTNLLEEAERLAIKASQHDKFEEDIERLTNKKSICRSSRLAKLDPVLDEYGLLQLNGRLKHAAIPNVCKFPVILDGGHRFTRLLVRREHERALHANNERVVNDLRQRYWILRVRPTVKAVAKECSTCRIKKATPTMPNFGDLPAERTEAFVRPFTNCGLDYFGPMTVTIGRRREKRWGALFTCLSTRAVHIELVGALTTDSAIMAMRRMAARRGWPRVMYSDNATNFRGADTELRRAIEVWESELKDYGLQQRMNWKYITPGAPHQGGAWERLIRSVKTSLLAVLFQKEPHEEILITLLAEVEHTINARPLTHVPVTPEDPEALTPNHFLLGGPSDMPLVGACEHVTKRTWKKAQALANEFWRRWVREYLPTLNPRGHLRHDRQALKVGDIVIVADAALPRNVWPRGRITQTFPGPDGEIRSVMVQSRGHQLKRPVTKVVVLPVEEAASRGLHRGEAVADGDYIDDGVAELQATGSAPM